MVLRAYGHDAFRQRVLVRSPRLMAIIMMALPLAGGSAYAQGWPAFWNELPASTPRHIKRFTKPNPPKKSGLPIEQDKADKAMSGPVVGVVSLASQRITIYDGTGVVARSQVSSGMIGHRTPTGIFSVIQKRRWHHSNIYSGAPMPFMQRITWSGIALHAGVVPGYPASHGCIRLPDGFAPTFWQMTGVGTRIIVVPQDTAPVDVAHPRLPTPTMRPPPSPSRQELAVYVGNIDDAGPIVRNVPSEGSIPASLAPVGVVSGTATRKLNPVEWALAAKDKAGSEAAAAAKAEKEALGLTASLSAEAARAAKALRKAESALSAAQAAVTETHRALAHARTGDARDLADDAYAAAAARLITANAATQRARVFALVKTSEASHATGEAKEAKEARADAQAAVSEAGQRLNPISIFVSRKTGRIYVRQGFKPVFDAPVAIRNPELAIGTHIFVATESRRDISALDWMAISVPERPSTGSDSGRSTRADRRGNRVQKSASLAPAWSHQETATGALDRIEIPDEAMLRISERLWSGASLIVSDHGLSHETGEATDFIVLTR